MAAAGDHDHGPRPDARRRTRRDSYARIGRARRARRHNPTRERHKATVEVSAMFEGLPDVIRAAEASPFAQEKDWRFTLNPPATEEQIRQAEARVGVPFPPDLRAFLLRWNGASLFRYFGPLLTEKL